MDAVHFDALARSLSTVASSRRRLLRGVAGSAVGALAVTLGFAEAGAIHSDCLHVGSRCKQASQCCSGICKRHKCRAHDTDICKAGQDSCVSPVACGVGSGVICNCLVTTGKAPFCALNSGTPSGCTRDEECVAAKGEGAACIVCGEGRLCMARCPAPF